MVLPGDYEFLSSRTMPSVVGEIVKPGQFRVPKICGIPVRFWSWQISAPALMRGFAGKSGYSASPRCRARLGPVNGQFTTTGSRVPGGRLLWGNDAGKHGAGLGRRDRQNLVPTRMRSILPIQLLPRLLIGSNVGCRFPVSGRSALGLGLNPLPAVRRLAVLHSSIDKLADPVDWNGKADPDIASSRTGHRCSNANKFSAQIYKRTAGVARIDRCIGLNEILVASDVKTGAVQSAHDSMSNSGSLAERITDGDNIIPNFQRVRFSHRKCDKTGSDYSYHRNVRVGIDINAIALEAPSVREGDRDICGMLDDMGACRDESRTTVDNDACAVDLQISGSVGGSGNPASGSIARGCSTGTRPFDVIRTTLGITFFTSGARVAEEVSARAPGG